MARANYQVLVLPFCIENGVVNYCIFYRVDMGIWQFIAGGGENEETHLESAKREAWEEAGISYESNYIALDTCCSIPTACFSDIQRKVWGEDCYVIPEYTFGVEIGKESVVIAQEHTAFRWVDYKTAEALLRYDSNKVALWELDRRIKRYKGE